MATEELTFDAAEQNLRSLIESVAGPQFNLNVLRLLEASLNLFVQHARSGT